LILGPTHYCGATRVAPTVAITAGHCVNDGLCGTATDFLGISVECEVAGVSQTTDFATLSLSPGSYADVVQIGRYKDGEDVECVSHKPAPHTRRRVASAREMTPPCVGSVCLPDTIRLYGYFVPGESGSGCFQDGKLVAVISMSNPPQKRAWATLVAE
jgi:hypothetical protein